MKQQLIMAIPTLHPAGVSSTKQQLDEASRARVCGLPRLSLLPDETPPPLLSYPPLPSRYTGAPYSPPLLCIIHYFKLLFHF
jgi:hypothetical protein